MKIVYWYLQKKCIWGIISGIPNFSYFLRTYKLHVRYSTNISQNGLQFHMQKMAHDSEPCNMDTCERQYLFQFCGTTNAVNI